jgi:hypothetical protein
MKRVFAILTVAVMVWGCSRKMAPAQSNTPSSNTGSTSSMNNNSTVSTTAATTTTTPATNTATTATNSGEATGSKSDMRSATMSPEQMGQSTYNAKCGRCHGLKVVDEYTDLRWVQIMQVMATKANLNETEKANVLVYVRANAKKG